MGINTGIAGCSGQVLVLPVRDVQVALGVAVFLCKSEINHVHLVATLANAHQEVVWLDVTMDKVFRVNVLDARDLRANQRIKRLVEW